MKILFFAPFSAIWEHAALEARLAQAMQVRGHEVVFVTCGGVLRRNCVVMTASGLPTDASEERRNAVCSDCRGRAGAIRRSFGLQGPELRDVIDAEMISEADRVSDQVRDVSGLEITWQGVPVGRRALFPFLNYKKRDNLDFSEQEWGDYRNQLQQTVLSIAASQQLIEQHRPDAIITYSSTYSVISAFSEFARKHGVLTYFIEASGNLAHRIDRAVFARDRIRMFYLALRDLWKGFADRPALPEQLREVTDYLLHLFGAKSVFVYSASSNVGEASLRDRFGVPPGARLLLATMSSSDEVFASEQAGLRPAFPAAFASQVEWIDWLRKYVAGRPDLFLIIRVHPREFPNRREREARFSGHARRLQQRLIDLPVNCVVNWPDQKVSLYDLAKEVDVVLNAWSSAGKELGLLGIPVVEWTPDLLSYAPQPGHFAVDEQGYREKIERALAQGWSGDNVRAMFRWCALEYCWSNVRTGDRRQPNPVTHFIWRAIGKFARRASPFGFDAWRERRKGFDPEAVATIEKVLEQGSATVVDCTAAAPARFRQDEAAAMATEIRRIAAALFGRRCPANRLHVNLLALSDQLAAEASGSTVR